jgi:catechol 2,3-dioxygenase-like lactoylglutathione lyase family enzyme
MIVVAPRMPVLIGGCVPDGHADLATIRGAAMTPPSTGFHHFSLTVRDVGASATWYARVLGLQQIPAPFPHWGNEESGHAIVLMDPGNGMIIGLHHHASNGGERADESRTGLDHLAFGVARHEDLDTWTAWLDELRIEHSGVIDATEPMPYSVVVFRDPDNIQLELSYMAG